MKNKFTSKIPWREKIDRITEFKVIDVPVRMQKRFGKGQDIRPENLLKITA